MLNELEQIYYLEPHRICQKWAHYFKIYEKYLGRFRGRKFRLLEIGVSQGGSLQLWKRYFGPLVEVIGLDVNPYCRNFEDDQTSIYVGDQGNREFMKKLAAELGQVDVVLDDGGHEMNQQIVTFESIFPILREGGVYICEGIHTSYSSAYGGGLRTPGSFIEYMKNKIDEIHGWYIPSIGGSEYMKWIGAITFYSSMVVIEKEKVEPPMYVEVGY